MDAPSILTADELVALTGYRTPGWQARELGRMRIPFTRNRRGKGNIVVLRSALSVERGRQPKPFDWSKVA